MKKTLLPLIFIIVAALMAPIVLLAAGPATQCLLSETELNDYDIRCPFVTTTTTDDVACKFSSTSSDCAMCCTVNTIIKTTNWIFLGVMATSAVIAILGGYFIVTAGGNADQVTKGRDFIKNSIIGLVIALLANAIPAVVRNVLGL